MMTVSSEVVDREVSRVAHDGPDRPHVQCVLAGLCLLSALSCRYRCHSLRLFPRHPTSPLFAPKMMSKINHSPSRNQEASTHHSIYHRAS